MLLIERQLEILKLINSNGSTRVADLAGKFNVTEETIRRDLDKLELEGKLIRSHGGAVAVSDTIAETPHWQREQVQREEKLAIAKEAVKRVKEGDRIYLGASSTACYLARHLPDIPLTVVTHAIQVTMALSEHLNVRVICIGGTLSRASQSFQGALAQENLKQYQIDKLFISGKAFHTDSGLSDDNEQHAMLKRDMISISAECFLIMDSSKFDKKALTLVAPIKSFSELITDNQIPEKTLQMITDQGVQVTQVKK